MKTVFLSAAVVLASVIAQAKTDRKPSATEGAVRGTGPLQVICQDKAGQTKTYNVNRLMYVSGTLTAVGFGPNRQDDGMLQIEGTCSIQLNPSAPKAPPLSGAKPAI